MLHHVLRAASEEETEFSIANPAHSHRYVAHFLGGGTVHISLCDKRSVCYLVIRCRRVGGLRVEKYLVAADYVETKICLGGHIGKFFLSDDLSVFLQFKVDVKISSVICTFGIGINDKAIV